MVDSPEGHVEPTARRRRALIHRRSRGIVAHRPPSGAPGVAHEGPWMRWSPGCAASGASTSYHLRLGRVAGGRGRRTLIPGTETEGRGRPLNARGAMKGRRSGCNVLLDARALLTFRSQRILRTIKMSARELITRPELQTLISAGSKYISILNWAGMAHMERYLRQALAQGPDALPLIDELKMRKFLVQGVIAAIGVRRVSLHVLSLPPSLPPSLPLSRSWTRSLLSPVSGILFSPAWRF